MKKPNVCILKTDGTNCDMEMSNAFKQAGGCTSIVHVNDLRNGLQNLADYQILACHDISEGGLITTVSEMCFGRNCGAKIDLNVDDLQATMFAEYAGCFVVEISRETDVKKIFHDIPITEIGHTAKTPEMSVKNNSRKIFTVTTLELKDAWQSTMKGIF